MEKSPHVSEPNISPLQQKALTVVSVTTTFPLGNVLPSAKSLLKPRASSLELIVEWLIRTFEVLMMFQPSRSLPVSMFSRSAETWLQPLLRIAK